MPQDVFEYIYREKDLKENRGRVKHRLIMWYSNKEKNNGILPQKDQEQLMEYR